MMIVDFQRCACVWVSCKWIQRVHLLYVPAFLCLDVAQHVCHWLCALPPVWIWRSLSGLIPGNNSVWMAAESGRVVTEEQEELPASGAVTHTHHAHTRSQSHIQIHPLTHNTQWQAPRALAHTRSHSHNHFSASSHTQKYGCRLTHSLSAMTKGERAAQGAAGKLNKPTEPLCPKTPQQVRFFLSIAQLGCEWMMGWRGEEKMESVISLVAYLFGINQSHCFLVYRNSTDSRFNAWKLIVFIWLFSSLCWDELPHDCFLLSDASNVSGLWWWRLLLSHPQQETKQFMDRRKECVTHLFLTYLAFWERLCVMCDWYLGASSW